MHWEKTVEYYFLTELASAGKIDFAAPLAGRQESAGDGIFGKDQKLILVEFKSRESDIRSEEKKFERFEAARVALMGKDRHHFIVYGEQSKGVLALAARTYFGGTAIEIQAVVDHGRKAVSFNRYMETLLRLRRRDERGSEKITVPEYAVVFGLSLESKVVRAFSLSEYTEQFLPSVAAKPSSAEDASAASTSGRTFRRKG